MNEQKKSNTSAIAIAAVVVALLVGAYVMIKGGSPQEATQAATEASDAVQTGSLQDAIKGVMNTAREEGQAAGEAAAQAGEQAAQAAGQATDAAAQAAGEAANAAQQAAGAAAGQAAQTAEEAAKAVQDAAKAAAQGGMERPAAPPAPAPAQ